MHRLLIVHPDDSTRALMVSMLQSAGHRLEEADSDRSAARMLEQAPVDLVLAGAEHDVSEALELISFVRRKAARTPVILFAASPNPEQMREAAQRGAIAFLKFPIPASQLRAAVAQSLPHIPHERGHFGETAAVSEKGYRNGHGAATALAVADGTSTAVLGLRGAGPNKRDNGLLDHAFGPELVGHDATMRQVFDLAEGIASRRSSVLIVGETGTGKQTLARMMHAKSPRGSERFRVLNCREESESDLEAELFGRGAESHFGDAQGLVAGGGTLFLEDVQALSPALQAHVLRAVRDAEFQSNGAGHSNAARLVLACSEDLGPLVERGQFRSDLFYALSAVTIQLPPLRHRGDDVLHLAEHFRGLFAREQGKSIVGISPEACRRLSSHDWRENVTELRSVMERAVTRCRGHWIEPNHLALDLQSVGAREGQALLGGSRQSILPLKEALEEPEKRLILEALRALNWNRQETARMLDINRTTLYKKMKKYGLIFDEPVWAN